MDLKIYKENLKSFFNNIEIIKLIYNEQFGTSYYEEKKEDCQLKFENIMNNTVFVPYYTMEQLEDFLILVRDSFGRKYISENYKEELEFFTKNSELIEQLGQSNFEDSKDFGNNKEEFDLLVHTINIKDHLNAVMDEVGNNYINQKYKDEIDLLKNLHNKEKNIIKKYSTFMLDELKQFYPQLNEDEYKKILKQCPNSTFEKNILMIQKLLQQKKIPPTKTGLLEKSKQEKIDKCISKFRKLVRDKIQMEPKNAKNIIKNYSSFMLDELKEFYPKLQPNEYEKILKKCSNSSFKDNISLIQELLQEKDIPKNKTGLFQKKKQQSIEKNINKCIEKYRTLVNEKILIETSSYSNNISDIPVDKYSVDILEHIKKGHADVTSKIGRNSNKNVRYIFLPILTYSNKNEYLKAVIHEVMHISKESICKNKYISGLSSHKLNKKPSVGNIKHKSHHGKISHYIKWTKFLKKHHLPISDEKASTLSRK